ncbi:MAG TPA: rhodanese-like domain-containing protein [Acidimicrobiales bacterium]|nr:rhodanese-like domain-containing protein [Acidimicrobiales bacterium]
MSGVDRLLAEARRQLSRVNAEEAYRLHAEGALLVDIRPAAQRAQFGDIPDALVIERNNLEWRLDPQGSHRLPEAADPDRPVVVICQEGYASSLAAASLLVLGRANATDLDGGFVAWKAAGYRTTEPAG